MLKVVKINLKFLIGIAILLFVINYLSTWRALGFGFWRDDWLKIWVFEIAKDPSYFNGTNLSLFFPLQLYQARLLAYFFNTNPLSWQLTGVLLRLISSVAAGFLISILSKSRKAAIITSLLLVSNIAGIESASWFSATYTSAAIILLSLGYFFWIKSLDITLKDGGNPMGKYYFIFSLLVFVLIVKGQTWSYYLVPLMTIIWDGLFLLEKRSLKVAKIIAYRLFILLAVLVVVYPLPPTPYALARNSGINKLVNLKASGFKNLFASLGNLTLGSFIYTPENAGLSLVLKRALYAGIFFILSVLSLGIFYLFRPSSNKRIYLFLLIWTVAFYLPRWVFESGITVGASHRYLAISAVGFYGFIAILLAKIKKRKIAHLLTFLLVINGIYLSNRVLKKLNKYRSNIVVNNVINGLDKSIPQKAVDPIIYYSGEGEIRGYIMDWSSGLLFDIRREIKDPNQFPVWTGSEDMVIKLMCGEKVKINLPAGKLVVEKGGYEDPLEHLFAFEVKSDGSVIDLTEQKRNDFSNSNICDG